ncbi:hypothetical protein SteCoe_31263 [Stentor coeruleus]|uniref:PA14 domain-containing protein n=1 Tax=Stentor coeruleus TaxID=5963 RepID=A0A1R2B1P2_9CILI|nr:hypothetical protein SteCoe_31263 [Stentor coeruleus]
MVKFLGSILFVSLIIDSVVSVNLPFYVISDTTNWVEGPSSSSGMFSIVTSTDSLWTASIPGANWIWDFSGSGPIGVGNFYKYFFIAGSPTSSTLEIAADGIFKTFINGQTISCDDTTGNTYLNKITCYPTLSAFVSGINVFHVEVTNASQGNCGLLYKLYVVSTY